MTTWYFWYHQSNIFILFTDVYHGLFSEFMAVIVLYGICWINNKSPKNEVILLQCKTGISRLMFERLKLVVSSWRSWWNVEQWVIWQLILQRRKWLFGFWNAINNISRLLKLKLCYSMRFILTPWRCKYIRTYICVYLYLKLFILNCVNFFNNDIASLEKFFIDRRSHVDLSWSSYWSYVWKLIQ